MIAIGCDHGGYKLKEEISKILNISTDNFIRIQRFWYI